MMTVIIQMMMMAVMIMSMTSVVVMMMVVILPMTRVMTTMMTVLHLLFILLLAGLQILYTLLQNVGQEEAAAQSFYQTYFCDILQHIFSVVTDTSHTAGESRSCDLLL